MWFGHKERHIYVAMEQNRVQEQIHTYTHTHTHVYVYVYATNTQQKCQSNPIVKRYFFQQKMEQLSM